MTPQRRASDRGPDPKRSAAAKKAAQTRRDMEAEREREEVWRAWIRFGVSTAVGAGVLIHETLRPEGPTLVGAAIGLSLMGLNVAAWLDRMVGK